MMKVSPAAREKNIEKQVTTLEKKLSLIQDTLEEWMKV
jgi:hypothetical protein